ncbi:MAG: UDP-N-acetylglucosamine--LPS N-acetylglucosamine transferase [Candidatus Melainabacteria bacterium]|nr:UDP-N-acetylglucosamine--LPS N-acetylglucosamine transferase [Candidatus Melainabacteria bacterium]
MFRKVMVLSASAGAGHVTAANALEGALRESGIAQEVINIDVLTKVSPFMRNVYSKQYIRLVNRAPHLLGAIYDATDHAGKFDGRRMTFDVANALPMLRLLTGEKPDLVVSTHFLASELAAFATRRRRLDAYLATVITDFDAHAFWLSDPVNHYFTAMEDTSRQLEHLGVNPQDISITGIPISVKFADAPTKPQARKQLALRDDLPVVLISAGGFGVGPVVETVESAMLCRSRFQTVVLCGKNEKLRAQLTRIQSSNPSYFRDFHPVGHTDSMQIYMAAADLMIGKSGGLTSSECLASGLPMLIVSPIPGQEERNANHLLEHGAAVSGSIRTLTYKLDKVLSAPNQLTGLTEAAAAMGHANSARNIVSRLQELAGAAPRQSLLR